MGNLFVDGSGHGQVGIAEVIVLFVGLKRNGARPLLAADLKQLLRRIGQEGDVLEEVFVAFCANCGLCRHRIELAG